VSETVHFSVSDVREPVGVGAGSFAMAANDVRACTIPTAPPEKFRAAIVSDGTLALYVPGKPQLDLTPEQARELYVFMQRMGYAAWPTAA
jgi:hypothetical protein